MNEHARIREDEDWEDLSHDAKGVDTVRAFIILVMYNGIYNVPWAYIFSGEFSLGCDFIGKVLPQKVFWRIFRHIRFGPTEDMPKQGDEGYHPYQAFLDGTGLFRKHSRSLWKLGYGMNYLFQIFLFQ